MKLLTVIFCLVVSVGALGQSRNTMLKDTTIYQLLQHVKTQPGTSDPLIMLDDSIYKGNINNIHANDIQSIDVLKGDDAKIIYGPGAEHGVFLMKTRKYVNGGIPAIEKLTRSPEKGDIIYVVDGVPVSKKQVNTNDILIRQSISGRKLEESGFYPEKMIDSLVVIVTKTSAIKSYQKKFGAFSTKYKEYLENHPTDDNYAYIINGTQIDYKTPDGIKKLYELPAEKIKKVSFLDGSKYAVKECVIITTKK